MMHDDLLDILPFGEVQHVRNSTGQYDVSIFAPGTVHVLGTVATGMNKNVAAWLAINISNNERFKGRKVPNLGTESSNISDNT